MKEFSQSCYDSFVYFNFDAEDVRILQKYPKSSANWFKSMKITFPNPMKSSCTVLSVKGQGACFWSKLFLFDTGAILLEADYQFKGPLTANYCLQQLQGQFVIGPHYFSDKSSKIDFVLQYGTWVIPVKVKGGDDRSAPSFKKYCLYTLSEKQESFFEAKD